MKSLVLLFGYGKELVWSIFPCWLEYRVRGILVHKVEREIAQDLKNAGASQLSLPNIFESKQVQISKSALAVRYIGLKKNER